MKLNPEWHIEVRSKKPAEITIKLDRKLRKGSGAYAVSQIRRRR
jgi:hypothetical protein